MKVKTIPTGLVTSCSDHDDLEDNHRAPDGLGVNDDNPSGLNDDHETLDSLDDDVMTPGDWTTDHFYSPHGGLGVWQWNALL